MNRLAFITLTQSTVVKDNILYAIQLKFKFPRFLSFQISTTFHPSFPAYPARCTCSPTVSAPSLTGIHQRQRTTLAESTWSDRPALPTRTSLSEQRRLPTCLPMNRIMHSLRPSSSTFSHVSSFPSFKCGHNMSYVSLQVSGSAQCRWGIQSTTPNSLQITSWMEFIDWSI